MSSDIIEDIQDKIGRFSYPCRLGIAPVLFHLGDVSDKAYEKQYFYRVIDIGLYLKGEEGAAKI